jgi:hypothetical protein
VPEALTVGVAVLPPETIPGPLQLKSVPEVVAPEREAEVVVQVRAPPVALAPGGVTLASTRADAVPVQPLVGSTTLTE